MLQCPQCSKPLLELAKRCPSCLADLGLLVDYVSHLEEGLRRAENLTRAGELHQAVQAYLAVLQVDPDNPTARRQVSQVATAVRQFDRSAPSRVWLTRLRSLIHDPEERKLFALARGTVVALLVVLAFTLGYNMAPSGGEAPPPPTAGPPVQKSPKTLGN